MNTTPFYMVWRENGNPPKFRHPDANLARFEAERLARMYPGERFFVLASIGDVRVSDTHWTPHKQFDDIPF